MNKKDINPVKLINYYKLINHNLIYNNKAINRYKKDNFELSGDKAENLDKLKKSILSLNNCDLKRQAKNIVFSDGNPNSKIMFIGEAPGANEVVPFMNDNIELLNISIDDQCPLVDTKLSDIIDLFQQDEDLSKNLKASIIRKFYIMKKKIFLTPIFLLTAILTL